MPLEDSNYLSGLAQLNPAGLDPKSEGDDHFRLVKKVLLNTFPGFNGPIWRKRAVSASGSLNATDNGAMVIANSAITLTPAPAGTLGSWMAFVRADGGTVTIDPTSSEKVNGNLTQQIPVGYTGLLFCDGTEFYMLLVYKDLVAQAKPFPTGTKMLFQQTAAPVGWTKLVSSIYDNAAIRVTTGSAASGGADAFTTVFAAGKETGGTTLTVGQIPPHTHSLNGAVLSGVGIIEDSGGQNPIAGQALSTGGGGSHDHTLTMNIKYVDFIVASID